MCKLRYFQVSLVVGFLINLSSIGVVAQNSEFKSIDELSAAFVQNDKQIGNKLGQIGKIRDDQLDKSDEIFEYRPIYFNTALDVSKAHNAWLSKQNTNTNFPVVNAIEVRKLKNIYFEKLKIFGKSDQKLKTLKEQLKTLIKAEKNGDAAVIKLKKRRLEIIGQSEFFNPPYLSEISILRKNSGLFNRIDTLYFKSWKSNSDLELLDANIQNKLAAIKEFEEMIAIAQKEVEKRRDEFLMSHSNWSSKNIEYENGFLWENFVRTVLESADVLIATQLGANVPAVLYELYWRGEDLYDWKFNNEGFKYEIPKVSEQYIHHIKKLGSSVEGGTLVANANGRSRNLVDTTIYGDSFWSVYIAGQTGEGIKFGLGFAATTMVEAQAQRALASDVSWWALYMRKNGSWDEAYALYRSKGGTAFEEFGSLRKHLRLGNDSFYDLFTNTLKNTDFQINAILDLAKSLGYTLVKDAANEGMVHKRFKIYQELAILEIDWFLKRNAYNKAMWFREHQKMILKNLMQSLGKLYAQKFKDCCKKEAVFLKNLQLATSQISSESHMEMFLKFNEPLSQDLKVSIEGQSNVVSPKAKRTKDVHKDEYAFLGAYFMDMGDLIDDVDTFEGGNLALNIIGTSNKGLPLDGNPETLAVYNIGSGEWKGFESRGAGDLTNTLNFVKPEVYTKVKSILSKPNQIPVEISFLAVNSFVKEAAINIYEESKPMRHPGFKNNPKEVLNGRVEGAVTLNVSLDPGNYEVRLDDGFGGVAALDKLIVAEPSGKLLMKAFDKTDKEVTFFVRIKKDNKHLKSVNGVALTEDLPVGKYKLLFLVEGEDLERNIEITENQTTSVEIRLSESGKNKKNIYVETPKVVFSENETIPVSYGVVLPAHLKDRQWAIILAKATSGIHEWISFLPQSGEVPKGTTNFNKLKPGNYEIRLLLQVPPSRANGLQFENLLAKTNFEIKGDENIDDEITIPIPEGWARGTLYNSNNGSCKYQGKYLIFMNAAGGIFKNLRTGEVNQVMVVAPGEKLEVAAPKDGAWIRVFTSNSNTVPHNRAGGSISHGTLNQLVDGWWYVAGCKNGTRPATPCNNGKGEGDNTYYGCNTLGG